MSARAGNSRPARRPAPPPPPPPLPIDFGLDAPGVVYGFGWGGIAALTVGVALVAAAGTSAPWARGLAAAALASGLVSVATALAMVASSRWGKVVMRNRLLDALALRGDERVLDVGCGRGLMLLGAATRLGSGGSAIGVDRWSTRDQRANRRDATLENAQRAGVADRVVVQDGDARALPFADGGFDLVLSSLAIHNLPTAADRATAIAEMVRVTRPGGRIVIIDIAKTGEYVDELRARGASSVLRSGLRFWIYPPVRLILARR